MNKEKGFTLIELLIVIVIISILAAIIFVAVDPATRFGDARDARRRSEIVSILNAVLKYQVDQDGNLPSGIDALDGSYQTLGTAGSGCEVGTCNGATGGTLAACVNLSASLVDKYLAAIPQDPETGDPLNTRYAINQTPSGRISVVACDPENSATISVSR